MEFWGVEVRSGESLPVDPGDGYIVRISQIALGPRGMDENDWVQMHMEVGEQRLLIGLLSHEMVPHLSAKLVLEKPFELSHSRENGSVFFTGYKIVNANEPEGNDDPEPADPVVVGSDEDSDEESDDVSDDEITSEEESGDEKVPLQPGTLDAGAASGGSDIDGLKKWVHDFPFTKGDSPPPEWPPVIQNPDERTEHDSFYSRLHLGVEYLSPNTTKSDLETLFGYGAVCSKLVPVFEEDGSVTSKNAEMRFQSLEDTKAALHASKGKELHGVLVRAMRASSNLYAFSVIGFETPLDEESIRNQLRDKFSQPEKGYEIEKITFPNVEIGLCYMHLWVSKSMSPIMTEEDIDMERRKDFEMGGTELQIKRCTLTFDANRSWLNEDDPNREDVYGQG